MLDKIRKRNKAHTISISYELLEKIAWATRGHLSLSAFIKMAIMNELRKRNIG